MSKKRVQWIDMLRITATWGVISIHGKSCYDFDIGTRKWIECNIMGGHLFFVFPFF